jgi:cobalt-zinc-cadmium efflux system membrane fusion protein
VLVANGEVGYDETHFAHVRPRVTGVVREIDVKPGDLVTKGQLLAIIDSAELGQAKADYLAALPLVELWTEALARNRGLSERGLVAEKIILEAETELRRAKAETIKVGQRLRNLGLDRPQIAALTDEDDENRNLLKITAPLDGTVVRRNAVAGEAVEPASEIFAVADLARVWVLLDVFEKDLQRLRVGQPVTFRVAGLAPAKFTGTVAWIDAELNDRTRTIRVRAEVDNTDGLLRAHMFGQGEIAVGEPHQSLVVPRDAVQWEGASFVVFVQKDRNRPDQYEPRRVLIGRQDGDRFELPWADVQLGELVVTTGSFLLKTEIMKGSIGAGCCGDD